MKRVAPLALSLLVLTPLLSGCSLFGGSSDLDDALGVAPASATDLVFVDREAIAERLGVGAVHTGASPAAVNRYLQTVSDAPASGTEEFLPYLQVMQDAPFSELDVAWALTGQVGTAPFSVFKMDDDIDLGTIGDDLAAAGFADATLDGHRHLTAAPASVTDPTTGLVATHYPADFLDVTLDDDDHLIILGGAGDEVLKTLDGHTDSLADAGTLVPVLPHTDRVEFATLDPSPRCGTQIGNLSSEQESEVTSLSAGLGSPTATSYAVRGDGAGATESAYLQFATAGAAAADETARRTYLSTGHLVNSGQDLSQLGSTSVGRDGDVVTVAVHFSEPARATEIAERGDGFLLCHADG